MAGTARLCEASFGELWSAMAGVVSRGKSGSGIARQGKAGKVTWGMLRMGGVWQGKFWQVWYVASRRV